MSHFKAILFDLGGTLLHLDYPFFQEEYAKRNQEIEQSGISIPPDELVKRP